MTTPRPKLIYKEIPEWPKLAWCAAMDLESSEVVVYHGHYVETRDEWSAEAVWPLDFEDGDFDQVDNVIGTGIRVRDERVIFVTAGDTNHRLQYTKDDHKLYVSNSTAALLVVADIDFVDGFDYAAAFYSITSGFHLAIREVPTSRNPLRLIHFDNLVVEDGGLRETPKPNKAPDFPDYETYRAFLSDHSKKIMANATSRQRKQPLESLATCSKGYDSLVMSLLAHENGVKNGAAISEARREPGVIVDADDSGKAVAEKIGLNCKLYTRFRENYEHEDAIWAAMGNGGDINLTIFDYPQPLCLLWTGLMGDVVWEEQNFLPGLMTREGGASGLRFSEARLEFGVMLCAPAFFAPFQEKQIQALYYHKEQDAYRVGGLYDRPVPRRILEEAGIERGTFATHKMASTFSRKHGAPISINLREDFFNYMRRRGRRAVTKPLEHISLGLRAVDSLLLKRLPKAIRFSCRDWIRLPEPTDFFLWANERRKRRFQEDFHR